MPLTSLERLRNLVSELTVIRASDLTKHRIHCHILKRALDRPLLVKMDRGLYISLDRPLEWRHRLALACKRVPHGVVYLVSALQFRGIFPQIPASP